MGQDQAQFFFQIFENLCTVELEFGVTVYRSQVSST